MIVALIGLEAGVIYQSVYVTLVLMALLTTLITPVVFRNWLLKDTSKNSSPVQGAKGK